MPAAEEAFRITTENIEQFVAVHRELVVALPLLAAKTKDYPVEVTIRGIRFVFDSEADIRRAIALIDAGLKKHAAA